MTADQPDKTARFDWSGEVVLQKYPGKGGWTYAVLPVNPPVSGRAFGWLVVTGRADGKELEAVSVMPVKDGGGLFMPFRTALRKRLGREAGDRVFLEVHIRSGAQSLEAEIHESLRDIDLQLAERFQSMDGPERKALVAWCGEPESDDEKARRILQLAARLRALPG